MKRLFWISASLIIPTTVNADIVTTIEDGWKALYRMECVVTGGTYDSSGTRKTSSSGQVIRHLSFHRDASVAYYGNMAFDSCETPQAVWAPRKLVICTREDESARIQLDPMSQRIQFTLKRDNGRERRESGTCKPLILN